MNHTSEWSVDVVQTYVPRYRVPFFSRLDSVLESSGLSLKVHIASNAISLRGDEAHAEPWLVVHRNSIGRPCRLQGASVVGHLPRSRRRALIVPLQATALETWAALLRRRIEGSRLGLWGHVGSYVKPGNALDLALERKLMKAADQIFAYTSGGSRLAESILGDAGRVTTVFNSVDVSYLRDSEPLESGSGVALGYVGALDSVKRIDFLVEVLDALWEMDHGITVYVAGRGPEEWRLGPAVRRGQVVWSGYGTDPDKRRLAVECGAFLMPGRIGLFAVEALAMGKPIVTLKSSFHAPEFEYLTAGDSVVLVDDDPREYARLALQVRRVEPQDWSYPSLDDMVENFARGVQRMLAKDRRWA